MKFKTLITLAALSTSSIAAENYRSFSELSYTDFDGGEITSIASQYYFANQTSLGPLDEFGYLDTDTNIEASYSTTDLTDTIYLEGEYFLGRFLLGAGYQYIEVETPFGDVDTDTYQASLGYLLDDNIILKATAIEPDEGDTEFLFSAEYTHKVSAHRYLGFTAEIDEDADDYQISSKYFTALGQGRYFKAEALYADNDWSDYWSLNASYYFTKGSNVWLGYDDNELATLGAKHYFNRNWAVEGEYANSNDDDIDYNAFKIAIIGQF